MPDSSEPRNSATPRPPQRLRQVHQHHHPRLRELVDNVNNCVKQRQASQSEVLALVDQLRQELLEHFQAEENEGFFTGVMEVAPRLQDKVNLLMHQHPQMSQQLEQLRTLAGDRQADAGWWESLSRTYVEFRELFLSHERGETMLLQEAYMRDIGAED